MQDDMLYIFASGNLYHCHSLGGSLNTLDLFGVCRYDFIGRLHILFTATVEVIYTCIGDFHRPEFVGRW